MNVIFITMMLFFAGKDSRDTIKYEILRKIFIAHLLMILAILVLYLLFLFLYLIGADIGV